MTRHYLHADQNNVKNAVALLPNVTGITTKEEENEAAQARLKAAVKAMEGLTADQLKKLIEKAGAEIKKLKEKAEKKSAEEKGTAKNV
jgi:type II secretory pathway pseudopilin PulG